MTKNLFDTLKKTWNWIWNSDSLLSLGTNPLLKVDNGLYNYSTGQDTVFKRTITLTNIGATELKVDSNITWFERGGRVRNIQIESHLFDWK